MQVTFIVVSFLWWLRCAIRVSRSGIRDMRFAMRDPGFKARISYPVTHIPKLVSRIAYLVSRRPHRHFTNSISLGRRSCRTTVRASPCSCRRAGGTVPWRRSARCLRASVRTRSGSHNAATLLSLHVTPYLQQLAHAFTLSPERSPARCASHLRSRQLAGHMRPANSATSAHRRRSSARAAWRYRR